MQFLIIINLCFYYLFCELVNSSRNLSAENQIFLKDNFENNVLKKFFIDLNDVYLQEYNPRHLIVLGASTYELLQTKSLFENYPYSICNESKVCLHLQQFNEKSLVILYVKNLSDDDFSKNIERLSGCRKCKILFISTTIDQPNDIRFIFSSATQHAIPYTRFAHLGTNGMKLYSEFVANNCSMQVRFVAIWEPGDNPHDLRNWVLRPRRMNGCPVSVSSLTFPPRMMIENNNNGSLTIAGGREGKLLLTIASKLNFTINLKYPSVEDQLKYSRKDSIRHDVGFGISEIGIGRLRPTNNLINISSISVPYDDECVTWGVPRVMNLWSENIMSVEFSWEVWLSISFIFSLGCIIGYVNRSTKSTIKTSEERSLGFIAIVLDMIAIHLGNPVTYVFTSAGGRFMLIAFLYYAMVMTTAYKTSLASILATHQRTPRIIDAQGIIDENLKVGGSAYDYRILRDQVNDSEVNLKLLKKFIINNSDSLPWRELFSTQDTAFLGRRSSLSYERQMLLKSNEPITFNVLDGCVLSHSTVIALPKKSFLLEPMDIIIQHLIESGIMSYWDREVTDLEKMLKYSSTEIDLEERSAYQFYDIFILYSVAMIVCTFIFSLELLVPIINSKMIERGRI